MYSVLYLPSWAPLLTPFCGSELPSAVMSLQSEELDVSSGGNSLNSWSSDSMIISSPFLKDFFYFTEMH